MANIDEMKGTIEEQHDDLNEIQLKSAYVSSVGESGTGLSLVLPSVINIVSRSNRFAKLLDESYHLRLPNAL